MTTIGVSFKVKQLTIGKDLVNLQIWDTAGQERFRNISRSYYKGAHGIAIVYDVTNQNSFDTISTWIHEISENSSQATVKVLIANKIDMTNLRVISEEQGRNLAEKHLFPYFETSAKDDNGVKEAFDYMGINITCLAKVTPSYLGHSKDSILLRANTKILAKKKCCEN